MTGIAVSRIDRETGEVVETPAVTLGTLRATTPDGVLAAAKAIATPLAKLIDEAGLVKSFGRKNDRYVMCEGWTALAAMLGCTPHEVEVREVEPGRFMATVELRRLTDGVVVGRASAECGPDEEKWRKSPLYARRSMALTRATAKTCRLCFSWVMVAAGYSATPAEEVPDGGQWDDGDEREAKALPTTLLIGKSKDVKIVEASEKHLTDVRDWVLAKQVEKKDETFFADLLEAVDRELARRAAAAGGAAE